MTVRLASLNCISFGVPFMLMADTDFVLANMRQSAPFGTRICDPSSANAHQFTLLSPQGTNGYRLEVNKQAVAEGAELKPILDQLARDLMVHVANHAPDRVFMHAGVVEWQGHALVLPGTSFAGKTTLVAELVRAGASYCSDEYAVLDERGLVHPYPRELQMRQPGCLDQYSVGVSELHGSVGTEPLAVKHVVFTKFVQSGRWMPEPVSAGVAVLDMLRHSIPVQRTPARVMAMLAKTMETATAFRSDRGEASDAAGALLAAMTGGGPCV